MRFPDLIVNRRDYGKYRKFRAERGKHIRDCVDFLIDAWMVIDPKMTAGGKVSDVTVLMQSRNVIEVLDGVDVLIREGCSQNCFHLLRSAWEIYWGILWVLADETGDRAKGYQVAHAHRSIEFAQRFDTATEMSRELRESLADQNYVEILEGTDVDSTAIVKKKLAMLDSPEYRDVEAEWQKALKKRGKKRGLPNWHALFDGPETTKQLARRVGEGVTYATFYGLYSDAIHGSNAFDHMAPAENGVGQSVRPIRHPFWINKASSQAGQLAVFLVAKLLKTYAPEQIEAFHRRYQASLRPMMRSLVGPDAMDAPWG